MTYATAFFVACQFRVLYDMYKYCCAFHILFNKCPDLLSVWEIYKNYAVLNSVLYLSKGLEKLAVLRGNLRRTEVEESWLDLWNHDGGCRHPLELWLKMVAFTVIRCLVNMLNLRAKAPRRIDYISSWPRSLVGVIFVVVCSMCYSNQ